MSVEMHVKINYGLVHMKAARDFATKCMQIEDEKKDLEWPQPNYTEVAHYAIGAVLLSVAALEAGINEIYLAAVDNAHKNYQQLSNDQVRMLSCLWEEIEQFSILKKYQVALVACGKETFNKGADPFQSVSDLITVRNRLVHFKPEWDNIPGEHKKIEKRLKKKFEENKLWKKSKGFA